MPRLCQKGSGPVIDHLGGSGCRYPDPAVWRTLPTKILPVCGTAGRCENQRSEASSRLRCLRCLPFCGRGCQHVFFAKNPPTGELGTMQKYRNRERKAVRRLRRSGCLFLQACLPLCVLRKKLAGEPGAMRKYRNQERNSVHRLPCPGCLLLQVCLSTCGFPHKKIPRLSRRGIFIRHLR